MPSPIKTAFNINQIHYCSITAVVVGANATCCGRHTIHERGSGQRRKGRNLIVASVPFGWSSSRRASATANMVRAAY
jgi:hypothetical protein